MAAFYSSFFSSGLLAPLPHEHERAPSPSTPRQSHTGLPVPDSSFPDPDTTPTAIDFALARSTPVASPDDVLPTVSTHAHKGSTSSISSTNSNPGNGRPTLRRRRSSLTASNTPLAAIKSSDKPRVARQALLVSRARSGSDAAGYARQAEPTMEANNFRGRMRSGSVGGANAKAARRLSRRPAPPLPAPPPTAPLPAPPSIQIPGGLPPITPRRPLARRAHTTDNRTSMPTLSPLPALVFSPASSPFATPGEEDYPMGGGVPSSPGYEPTAERWGGKMQVDYPSPVDGERRFMWERENVRGL